MSIIDLATYLPARQTDVSADDFKVAMRNLAGAVSVVTVGTGERRTGFTATSVTSFSADPPTVLVSLNRSSSTWPVLRDSRSFAVNILADNQSAVADRFAGRGGIKGPDRYVGWEWNQLASDSLGLKNAVAVIDCDIDEVIERHSHAIVLGRVLSVKAAASKPLLYWQGKYQQLLADHDPFFS